MTIQEALQLAIDHHNAGRVYPAEQVYRQILAQQPNMPHAMVYLSILLLQTGRFAESAKCAQQAVAVVPQAGEAQLALADALLHLGQISQSIDRYQTALSILPEHALAWLNYSRALQAANRMDESLEACRTALRHQPDLPDAHLNLAETCRLIGRFDEAIAHARQTVHLLPQHAQAHLTLGNALLGAGQPVEAIASLESAIALQPDFGDAHNNLGIALLAIGRTDECLRAFRHAVQLQPNHASKLVNLSHALEKAGQFEEALRVAENAVKLEPNLPDAWNQFGVLLARLNRPEQAIDAFHKAIQFNHRFIHAHNNLGNVLKDQGRVSESIEVYRKALELDPSHAPAWSNLLYTMHFDPRLGGGAILAEHLRWATSQAEPLRPQTPQFDNDRAPARRLRIGYVSADFRRHVVGTFMLPLLENHDHSAFEIFCYADVINTDPMTDRLRACADTWRFTAHLSAAALAEQIRADKIDILVDLALHASENRMLAFARKPAPVQVTYLGYPSTSGLTTMDWRITDRFLDPPNQPRPFYSERSAYLETTYWCYREPEIATEVSAPPCLSKDYVTFGCFNNFVKASDVALAAWAQILATSKNSRLIIHADPGGHRRRVNGAFAPHGIGEDRVEFIDRMPLGQYLERYAKVDIALDPFPYCGATTTCDALWMGVPVVSLVGDIAVRRAGLSLLSRLGLSELATTSIPAYIDAAIQLAKDPARLTTLRRELRERMRHSPLMDAPAFTRDVERFYRDMWADWLKTNSR